MLSRHDLTIGEATFHVQKLPAFKALEVGAELQKRFLAPMLSAVDGRAAATPQEADAGFARGIEKALGNLDADAVRWLKKNLMDPEMVSVTLDGGQPQKLGALVEDMALPDAADVLDLLAFIVKLNFQRVFQRAGGVTGMARFLPAASSPAPSALN